MTSKWTTEKGNAENDTRGDRKEIIKNLFENQSPKSAKWIARLILKNLMPIRFEWEALLACFHPCLVRIYKIRASLRETAQVLSLILKHKEYHPHNMYLDNEKFDLSLYKKILQQYCKPIVGTRISTMESIQTKCTAHVYHYLSYEQKEEDFIAELKYDGERMQIHLQCHDADTIDVKIFSKSGRDSTMDRSETIPIIKESLGLPWNANVVKNIILEGELLTFDSTANQIQRFGGVSHFTYKKSKKYTTQGNNVGLYIVFFDLLYFNDQCLLYQPLGVRRKLLEKVIIPIPGCSRLSEIYHFNIGNRWTLDSFKTLRTFFMRVKSEGQEGLMIKGLSSPYLAGMRENWMKMKPDYMAGLGDTAEYLVVGASWNPSSSAKYTNVSFCDCHGMNRFFVAVLVNKAQVNDNGVKPHFLVLFSFENGFSEQELMEFSRRLVQSRNGYSYNLDETESYKLTVAPNLKSQIQYLVSPTIVTLKGSSFEFCQDNHCWVLRHPRLERECCGDKGWDSILSFQELQQLGESSEAPCPDSLLYLEKRIMELDQSYLTTGTIPTEKRQKKVSSLLSEPLEGSFNAPLVAPPVLNRTFSTQNSQLDDPIELASCFTFNAPKDLKLASKGPLHSGDSLLMACAWRCPGGSLKHTHYNVVIFVSSRAEGYQMLETLENIGASGHCKPQLIYLVDVKLFSVLSNPTHIHPDFLLAACSPLVTTN